MSIFNLMSSFERAGFSFYEYGSVKENGKRIATFYKGDLMQETREKLLASIPNVFFLGSKCEYAPEIKSSLVCIPSK